MSEPTTDGRLRVVITRLSPEIDGGRFAIKRVSGEKVVVEADVFADGHDQVCCQILYWRDGNQPQVSPMKPLGNDRWRGEFSVAESGRYQYTVEGWIDRFQTWRNDLQKRVAAKQDVSVDLLIGAGLIEAAAGRAKGEDAKVLLDWAQRLRTSEQDESRESLALDTDLLKLIQLYPDSEVATQYDKRLTVIVDREKAGFSAWYELFPRSCSAEQNRHGTLRDCEQCLPYIAAMGFDVVYLPPIHPIGKTFRKGKNNSVPAHLDDVGSPWAIGSSEGGHKSIHPQLGTMEDFRRFLTKAADLGLEVALDIALQCAPDHPYVQEHREWFSSRPDGSIQYAENPPKKYQDIYPLDFTTPQWQSLWQELKSIFLFWIEQGVRIFRVDNPHTKAFAFWEWLIREVQSVDADVIFLSEAFTRPKVMKALAKLGFNQSYTYFTWRTGKEELQTYLSEITGYPEREYFRPNFFVNTPDILPFHLQSGEPWIFKARVALAATLSGNYGIYNGFELLEHEAIPGKEEYLDSEKYELKVRDWDWPGNIKDYIGRLNRIRRDNAALLQTSNLRFAQIDDNEVIGFIKESVARYNAVAVAVALTKAGPREFWFHFGDIEIGPSTPRRHVKLIENLVTGERHIIEWGGVRLRIDQQQDPVLLFRCFA